MPCTWGLGFRGAAVMFRSLHAPRTVVYSTSYLQASSPVWGPPLSCGQRSEKGTSAANSLAIANQPRSGRDRRRALECLERNTPTPRTLASASPHANRCCPLVCQASDTLRRCSDPHQGLGSIVQSLDVTGRRDPCQGLGCTGQGRHQPGSRDSPHQPQPEASLKVPPRKARLPNQPERHAPRETGRKASREPRAVVSENAPAYQRDACPEVDAEQYLTRCSAVALKKRKQRPLAISCRGWTSTVERRQTGYLNVAPRQRRHPLFWSETSRRGQRQSPGKDSRILLSRETPSELWPRPGPGKKGSGARVC